MIEIKVPKGKQIYFTSDHHFGAPSKDASKPREVKFIKWLDQIKKDADTLFIVGDLLSSGCHVDLKFCQLADLDLVNI